MTRIIADCCANHCGSRELMETMIKTAANVGVDIVKFQSFRADKLNKDWPNYEEAYQYYKQHELSNDDHVWLIRKCQENNIEFLTTVFDLEAVDFLCSIGLKKVKIASPDANNWDLIDKCLKQFDEVIISTGMHTPQEVAELISYITTQGKQNNVTLLHCVSLYPTPLESVNMLHMGALMKAFPNVGFSDHTTTTDAGKLAIALGASIVEKHFTLDRKYPGKDQKLSALPKHFRELVDWRNKVQSMMYDQEPHKDLVNSAYRSRWSNA